MMLRVFPVSSLIETDLDYLSESANMPDGSCQRARNSPARSMALSHETAATKQRYPSSGQPPQQQKGDLYIIHDMATEGQHIDTNSATRVEQGIMEMLDNLVVEMSTHHPSDIAGWDAASPDSASQVLLGGARNDRPQDLSFVMRRWKSLPVGALPWHCTGLVGATARGRTGHHSRAGTEDNEWNNEGGAANSAEEAESNKALAGSETEELEERLAEAIAN
jgi:hypothetical protein